MYECISYRYVPSETSVGFKQQQLEAQVYIYCTYLTYMYIPVCVVLIIYDYANLQAEKESFLSENQKLAKQLKIIRESREVRYMCIYIYMHVCTCTLFTVPAYIFIV